MTFCESPPRPAPPPTGGHVVSISLDTRDENWRHERPKVTAVGGTRDKPAFTNVGDPVASGIALANGVAYAAPVGGSPFSVRDPG